MKLTAILLLTASLHLCAKGLGQNVSLSLKDAPMKTLFIELNKQTGYSFLYSDEMLAGAKNVTIEVRNTPLDEVLKKCFRDQPLDYSFEDGAIVLRKKNITAPVEQLSPPPSEITGRITNEQGQPLAGASVIIKRTGHGDISNANGEFTLKNVNNDDILIISYVGYKQQKIRVGSITSFTIVMEVTTDELDQVKIQAYGKTTDRLRTGNISTVTSEQIERQPVMNPLAALQGQVPGLVITQTSGYASAPFKAEIRGRTTISGQLPSEPLYIIDGVPLTTLSLPGQSSDSYQTGSFGVLQNGYMSGPANGQSPFFNINPADIESISVLKDADATAIYGSRGANGVILITTKNGKIGKTKVDANFYYGVSEVTGRYPMMNTQQYLLMRREALKNDGLSPDPGNAYDMLTWDTTRYTNWQNFFWGKRGITTDAQLGVSGGDKQNTFRIGGGYHHETSILSQSGADQRASVQFNFTHKTLDQRLSISFQNAYSYTQSNLIYLNGSVLLPPDAPAALSTERKINFDGWSPVSYMADNFSSLFQPYISKTGFLNSELNLDYEIFKGLNFRTQFGYSSTQNSQIRTAPIYSQNPQETSTGTASFGKNNNSNLIVEPQLEYRHLFGTGKFDLLIGGSSQKTTQDGAFQQGSGYINDNFLQSISNAPQKFASEASAVYKYAALFGRINYDLNDKYILNLSARRDGSSRFGPGRQYGNFGAIGAAWVFTQEQWFKKHFQFLSFGKLRASYGITGNDQIGDYAFLTRWTQLTQPYQGTSSYQPIQHANPLLQWEVNRKAEAALDLNFIHDRLKFELSAYRNRSGNQLISEPLPALSGFNFVTTNSPALVQNRGVEMELHGDIINNKDFNWSVHFNIGINRNKLLAFPDLDKSPYANAFVIGQPLSITKLLHYTGVDPNTGQYTYEDKNHDGQINPYAGDTANDLFLEDLSVKYDGGFGTDFKFKGFQLNILFIFRKQILPSALYSSIPGGIGNQSTEVLDRWKAPGDHAKFARFTTQPTDFDSYFTQSDGVFSDGSYIRLRNVSLSYEVPSNSIKRIGIAGAKLYLRGENLFVLTKYHGLDPDVPGFGVLPPSRVFTGGIQINL